MDSQARIRENMRHIQAFEAKPNPKPLAETAVTRGFEKVAFPKLVAELSGNNPIVRQKALLAARELLTSPINLVQCVAAGATPAIVALLQDPDEVTRGYAAGTLVLLACKEVGTRDLVQHGGMEALAQALEDECETVRDNAYSAFIEATRFDWTRRALEGLQVVLPRIMELVLLEVQEAPQRAQQGLAVLYACTQVRRNADVLTQLIDTSVAIPRLAELLDPELPEPVRHSAAELLGALASREDAKIQAVQVGSVPLLLGVCSPRSHVAFATAAVAALSAITIRREGKYAVVEAEGGCEALTSVLDPTNEQLCINAMTAICNVAEAPEAREILAECGAAPKLQRIFEGAVSEPLKRSAAQAIRQCRFKHLPYEVLPGAPPLVAE
ncbi:40S ribosomal protein S14-B (RP59B) [Pleodorina starrii]|uniref:40S ribosomal protein S14-B (RP59B) n=1 Tax=Pleodorina starrii TaxID=330485 RepID=A0A9W6BKW6_9CHLO|nr:40S ribosomal protein S14-B (RP59B) [Pleodorina starrii]GLC54146.1 40S ribosomal protein S14-B (RP59B) [Pleodorina starrii]GLC64551.1 40S ribosomal protein S14-B (RP59B) [Pleodorina starrii]